MRTGARQGKHADRGNDLYETPACAVHALVKTGELNSARWIWEPCAGRGAISRELRKDGFRYIVAADLIHYDGADPDIEGGHDFFLMTACSERIIVTNPPFMRADDFVRHGLKLGCKVIVLLRLMALEGAGRSDIIDGHLRRVWMGRERLPWMQRDGWTGVRQSNSGAPFAWFVFDPEKREGPIDLRRISWRDGSVGGGYLA